MAAAARTPGGPQVRSIHKHNLEDEMGISFAQMHSQASQIGSAALVDMTIATNQDDGIVSYAQGTLGFTPGGQLGAGTTMIFRGDQFNTQAPLLYYFSNRMLDIDPPPKPGVFGHSPRQPFSANAVDQIGVAIQLPVVVTGQISVTFTLNSWGNTKFSFTAAPMDNLLVGVGPAVGNNTTHAVYTIAFTNVGRPPQIH
jgi:hypothetical protein